MSIRPVKRLVEAKPAREGEVTDNDGTHARVGRTNGVSERAACRLVGSRLTRDRGPGSCPRHRGHPGIARGTRARHAPPATGERSRRALTRLTGTTAREFAERNLFGPAGIVLARWDADPQGVNFGGSEMFLTTREMLKLGILYLHHGKVGERQVIPASWITESSAKHYDITVPVYRSMVPNLTGYGYLWWLRSAAGHEMICALGLGGQFVLVVPSLELVIAGTSALDARNPRNDKQFNGIFDLLDRAVITAAH